MSPETLSECLSGARTRVDQATALLTSPSLAAALRCDKVLSEAVAHLRRCEMIVRSEVYTPDSTLAWEAEELRKSVGRLDQLLKGFLSLCRAFSDSLALCSGGYDRTGQPAARPCRRSLSVDY